MATTSISAASAGDLFCDNACADQCDSIDLCESSCFDSECCDSNFCDPSCCDSGCCDLGCLDSITASLRKVIQPSDRCFDDFISPMIDFVHFEDPRNLTELRPIFVTHQVPDTLGPGNIPAGGSLQLFAMQFRLALTDRLSLIGVKDGYVIDNSEGALDGLIASGWADITAGLKYNLLRNTQTGTLLSGGFTYEIPMGSEQTLQSIGDGQFNFFVTGGQRLANGNAHILSSFGWQLPVDQEVQTTTVRWNNHFDVKVTDTVYLFTENSWTHWVKDADVGSAFGVGGQDLLNLGATDVEGNNLVTHNVGTRYKPSRRFEAGVAYEFPLTEFKDIIEDRVTLDMIFRY
ncbi:hypothetical protein [Rubripirellula obstinata]|uniref:hypothetical protein n=1 Tax=Rubripirellula obstinata TaxID=406547 RepID=UPI001F15FBCD|nr:hypothetical protein [Rubripirellula obstinata]